MKNNHQFETFNRGPNRSRTLVLRLTQKVHSFGVTESCFCGPHFGAVRQSALGCLVNFHAHARMEDNENTWRTLAHLQNSQCF
jgi:hypothetical protein